MRKIKISALVFGIIAAFTAVIAQVLLSFHPPAAYGICVVCHARDMVNALLSQFPWYGAPVSSLAMKGLILTTVGIIIGGAVAAIMSGEWKLQKIGNPFFAFIFGFIVMCCGLIISGCPMRILLRSAYGDTGAMISIVFLIVGIYLATILLKRRAKMK